MSAWVVTKHHIDLLVSAALERGIAVKFAPIDEAVTITAATAEEIGLLLWGENMSSVIYRYSLDGSDEATAYLQDLAGYRFRFYPGVRASAVAQALTCFDYQACEHPTYEHSAAAFFVSQLRTAIGNPGDTDAEPWGFDSEDAVLAATITQGAAT